MKKFDMEQQRKVFLYELNGHGYHFKNTDWYDDWERFEDEQLNMVWEMWLAAQQQDGYVMVPIEPALETMQKMNREFIDSKFDTPKRRMQQVYKVVTQVAQE